MAVEEGSPTRRSGRERVQTRKQWNSTGGRGECWAKMEVVKMRQDKIEVDEGAPAPRRPRRTEISAHLKDCVVATKIRALSAKTGEHQTTAGAIPNQWTSEKVISAGNTQMK